jgi:hypothetical protein
MKNQYKAVMSNTICPEMRITVSMDNDNENFMTGLDIY